MAIINRDTSRSQRRQNFELNLATLATGVTSIIGMAPVNGIVTGTYGSAIGISNVPTSSFSLYRFIIGTGFTAISVGATLAFPAFGTSGWIYYGATINGNTTANVLGVTVLQGDLLVSLSAGTNSSLTTATIGMVIEPTDDILRWPGL